MTTGPRLKTFLFVILAAVAAWLAAGTYQSSRAHEERLRHDSRTIETMLSETSSPTP